MVMAGDLFRFFCVEYLQRYMTETCVRVDQNRSSICIVGSALIAAGVLLFAACSLPAQDLKVQTDAFASADAAESDAEAASPRGVIGQLERAEQSTQPSPAQQPAETPPAQSTQQSAQPQPAQQPGLPDAPKPSDESGKKDCKIIPCPTPFINWYMRFENGPQVKPMTPKEKAWLATKNLIDPFNLITILGTAGISVAADPHSAYGPGMPGFARYVGVTFTEDMTGEFFNTFLIPSIMHQDPHYHRMPQAKYPRRVLHAITQVAWTQGDDGKGMLNYGNLVGFAIDDEIGNLYIPGRETNGAATAQRYAIGLATAPIDNFVSEFLPDVAKHIHVQVVIVQRIINQIASKDSGGF
jgi:hypothetical protein